MDNKLIITDITDDEVALIELTLPEGYSVIENGIGCRFTNSIKSPSGTINYVEKRPIHSMPVYYLVEDNGKLISIEHRVLSKHRQPIHIHDITRYNSGFNNRRVDTELTEEKPLTMAEIYVRR